MMMTEPSRMISVGLIQMLTELVRRKWLIGAWTISAAAITAIVVIVVPSRYTATATLLAPASSTPGLGSIKGLSGISDLLGMSLGGAESPEYVLTSLLSSRTIALKMNEKFHLDSVWEMKEWNNEDIEKRWAKCFSFQFDDNDALLMHYEDKSPERAQQILNAVIYWTDSAFRSVNQEQAQRNLAFFDVRLAERKQMLTNAEDSMVSFQRKTGSFLPSEQIKQSIIEASKLESQAEQLGIQADLDRRMNGATSSNAAQLEALKSELRSHLKHLSSGDRTPGKLLKEFSPALQDQLQYERLNRQILIHGTVYAFLNQQREQAALERSRNTALLIAIDSPSKPAKRSFPKRRLFVQAAAMFGLLVSSVYVIFAWWIRESADDPLAIAFRDLLASLRRIK